MLDLNMTLHSCESTRDFGVMRVLSWLRDWVYIHPKNSFAKCSLSSCGSQSYYAFLKLGLEDLLLRNVIWG